jgi:amidase
MAIRLPTADDLHEIAAANYFELNDEELDAFEALIPGLFQGYQQLDSMTVPREPLKYRDRDAGYRPSKEEDPLNAILRRCTVKGASSGKLAGKRFGLKNNVNVAGMPMTFGSLVLDGYVAESDATIVTWLLDAGAELVANLNMENFAFSGRGDTSAFGAVLNPHSPEHLAGGSSSGSAASLYYDDIDITIGGDQGGSIRVPSSYCGVVGLKPTHSLVPYTGIVGIDQTFDHAGPMARSVEDAALTLEVIAGKDPLDPRQYDVPVQPYADFLGKGVAGMRIGVVTEGFGREESESDVDELVRRATRTLGELGGSR